ncbi:PHD finger protein 12-like isoform X2 [Pseudomyrmex gracilis]|uniref:PHD finger protein 12-like isoform X2 n=1 Tax=Pseudomyrmex gracilis TaxID=219809 RepID=UPI00099582B2|nr:PHD finger protein 12-like isoform X2 [Pseudomyrmex gracilis]
MALAAAMVSPREFELPRELQMPITFPGSSKTDYVSGRRGRYGNSSNNADRSHCLDSNLLVPLPPRLCFQCRRSCMKATLLPCDYCPLYFHLDCLDPPLTCMPTGRWMCPNHPNHFIDQNLVRSCSATERMKLWDKYANQPIDQHAVKMDFLRKARRTNPIFRTKGKVRNRLPLNPPVPGAVKHYYKNPIKLEPLHQPPDIFLWPERENMRHIIIEKLYKDSNVENKETIDVEEHKPIDKEIQKKRDSEKYQHAILNGDYDPQKTESASGIKDEYTDLHEICYKYGLNPARGSSIEEGIKLLERSALEVLASQAIWQLIHPDEEPKLCQETYNMDLNFLISLDPNARAALCFVGSEHKPPAFIRSVLQIGNGPNCDLVLAEYSNCRFISSIHAILFYDKLSNCFEILNYSEYGTVVDNTLYSVFYDPKRIKDQYSNNCDKNDPVLLRTLEKEKDINEKNRHLQQNLNDDKNCNCYTKANRGINKGDELEEGGEGGGILQDGSILMFGCMTFVLKILKTD